MEAAALQRDLARLVEPTVAGGRAVLPPLLVQLADAVANSGEAGDGLRSYAHSSPPIDLGAFDLWRTIDAGAREWAAVCGVDPGPVCAGQDSVGQVAGLLRAAAVRVVERGETAAERFADDVAAWTGRIEGLLNPARTVRRIWGAECPHCEQTMTTSWVDEQRLRVPAIALVPEAAGRAAALVCGHCGWTRRVPVTGGQ